jgi:hypothetical protein
MFDPAGPDRKEVPAFSLDRKDQMRARMKSKLTRMEKRVIVFMPVLIIVLAWVAYDLRDKLDAAREAGLKPVAADIHLTPMSRPTYDSLPALPDETAVATLRPMAQELVGRGAGVPLTSDGLDAATIAWAEARLAADRVAPPFPQRLSARDLLLTDHVRLGTPLILEGRLEDRLPAPVGGSDRPWQRLLLAIDEGQFAEILSEAREAATLPLGGSVRITGRLLNYGELKTATGNVNVPIIMGRVLVEAASSGGEQDALSEYHQAWNLPADLYADVDDFRLWTETRPYYYTLGQVQLDKTTAGVYGEVPDGNQAADEVHLRPSDFRGKPFKVTGYVYQAWEDTEVAHDQPFGVGRVVRVLVYRRDLAPYTETVDGVTSTTVKLVLRLYEFASITNQPLPEIGSLISATGRFLKKRAIAVEANAMRDKYNQVERQSDRVYTWMYVTGPWQLVPEPPPDRIGPFGWSIAVVGLIGLVVGIVWWRKEVREGAVRAERKVAELRERRLAATNRAATTAAPPAPSQDAGPGQAPPPT